MSQFVKLGQSVAEISIELYSKDHTNACLKRTIFVNGKACQYQINNIMVTKKKV